MTVDAERLLSGWLRTRDDVADLVDGRIYTELPRQATFPLIRLTQIAGEPVHSRPLWLDWAVIQFDFYGGPKAHARRMLDTTRDALATQLVGIHPLGVVTSVRFGLTSYIPDDIFDPPKPRWIAEVSVYTHP